MKRIVKLICAATAVVVLASCATAAGTAVGAGIGSLSGNTEAGALMGGGVGMMVDIM